MPIPGLHLIAQTRRSHAMEHATLHLLNRRFPTQHLGGLSTPYGFYVLGHIPADDVRDAAAQALARLKRGERQLAIHPRCGTNTVTAGILVGLVLFLANLPGGKRSRWERLPWMLLLSTLTLLLAQPLGTLVQESVTVNPHHRDTTIAGIERPWAAPVPLHWVRLHYGDPS